MKMDSRLIRQILFVTGVFFVLFMLAASVDRLTISWRGVAASTAIGLLMGFVLWKYKEAVEEQTAVLAQRNTLLEEQISAQENAARILRHIAEGTAQATGSDFFMLLTRHMASALDVDYVLVGQVMGEKRDAIRTLSFWEKSGHASNFVYDLEGTPCGMVVGQELCYYPERVSELFPEDVSLTAMQVACYMGIPIFDANGQALGLMAVLHSRPLSEEYVPIAQSMLRIFAARAGVEMERQRHAAELEMRVEARTQELAAANEQLQELDLLKSKFVSDVSHEFRTPIATLKLYLDLLANNDPEKLARYRQVMQAQVDRLERLIEDILDLSQMEAESLNISFMPVDLNDIAEQVALTLRPQALENGLELTFDPDPALPTVLGQTDRLAQVVTNLVANAINYTPSGQVGVKTYREDDGRIAYLQVRDTGVGINPEEQPCLFNRFFRGERTRRLDKPGTGLGLAIVKEIVERHSGWVEVESEIDKGSTFLVCLPVVKDGRAAAIN